MEQQFLYTSLALSLNVKVNVLNNFALNLSLTLQNRCTFMQFKCNLYYFVMLNLNLFFKTIVRKNAA